MPDCLCGLSGFFASTHLNYRAALKIKKSLHINPHRNHRHAGHCGFIENMYISRIFCRCFSYHLTSTGRYCKIWISTAKKHSATKWKAAMARFDAAAPDEAKIVALEVEAARRRYIFLLEQRRAEQ